MSSDRNLLFGILALQMNFIDRDALVAAMNRWVMDKRKPLGHVLLDQGQLTAEQLSALDVLIAQHLKAHGDDPQRSLLSVATMTPVHSALAEVTDDELQTTLANVGSGTDPSVEDGFRSAAAPSAGPRYRKLNSHASGGLGEVFLAEDTELHREVALKEILPKLADDPASRRRFLMEAEITGGLEHPGVVPVHSLGSHADGRPFYVMRFIRGDSFKEAIQRFHAADVPERDPGERSLAIRQLLRRFVDVCNAVAFAHSRGVLHRDIKPANIMLGLFGETLVVDWGLAKAGVSRAHTPVDDDEVTTDGVLRPSSGSADFATQAGSAIGTPPYMSPEQAAGKFDLLGPASDVYSLGVTLFVLLTGHKPFDAKDARELLGLIQRGQFSPPRDVKPHVPAPLDAICCKAMALRPDDRYKSALDLAADIEHWLADEPVAAYAEPWTARSARWARRHRTTVAAAGVLLASAAVALAVSTALIWREEQKTEKQRQIAEGNFEQARNFAVDVMSIIEAHEADIAAVPLLHRARKELLKRASQTLGKELERDPDNLELQARTALTYRYTANVHRLSDETKEAGPRYQQAITLEKNLEGETPQGLAHRLRLAEVLRDHAKLLSNLGRLQEAQAGLEDSIQIIGTLPAEKGKEHATLRSLAVARLSLAAMQYRRGQFDDAGKLAQQTASDFETLDRIFPADGSHPYDKVLLAAAINIIAGVQRESGRVAAAMPLHRKAAAALDDLWKHPRQGLNKNDVAHFLAAIHLAECKTWQKTASAWRSADGNLSEAIKQWEELTPRFPDVPMYRDSLAEAYRMRGEIRTGWTPVATNVIRQHALTMLGATPMQCAYISSRVLRWTPIDRRAEGLKDLEKSRQLLEQRVEEFPDLPSPKGDLGKTYLALSRAASTNAERDSWLTKARDILRKAVEQCPDDAQLGQALREAQKEQAE